MRKLPHAQSQFLLKVNFGNKKNISGFDGFRFDKKNLATEQENISQNTQNLKVEMT